VAWDKNKDCNLAPDEPYLPQWSEVLLSKFGSAGEVVAQTSAPIAADGTYEIRIETLGEYSIRPVLPLTALWSLSCANLNISVKTLGDTTMHNLAVRAGLDCPILQADIGTAGLRPCEDNTYTLRYCNTGTTTATGAFVRVRLDRFLSLTASSVPALNEDKGLWRFELGDLPAQDCGLLLLTARLDCDSTLPGQTYCVEAHIYPDTACVKSGSGGGIPVFPWYTGTVDLDGTCAADSVRFTLRSGSSKGRGTAEHRMRSARALATSTPVAATRPSLFSAMP
jgi:hypothetical protein